MTEMQSLEIRTCPTVSTHDSTVSVPVRIVPFANPGTVVVQCCGDPVITPGATPAGTVNGSCPFTVSQTMRIDIPMVFGASVLIGDTYVECGGTTGTSEGEDGCGCAAVAAEEETEETEVEVEIEVE